MKEIPNGRNVAIMRRPPDKMLPGPKTHPKKMSRLPLCLVVLMGLATACRFAPNEVQAYRHIDPQGWYADSLVQIDFPVVDTLSLYDMRLGLRYTDDYNYANLWLFITTVSPDGAQRVDTLNATLCDTYGRWLGSGIGERLQQEIPIKSALRFDRSGTWHIVIQQGMRDNCLPGITEVGIKLSAP